MNDKNRAGLSEYQTLQKELTWPLSRNISSVHTAADRTLTDYEELTRSMAGASRSYIDGL